MALSEIYSMNYAGVYTADRLNRDGDMPVRHQEDAAARVTGQKAGEAEAVQEAADDKQQEAVGSRAPRVSDPARFTFDFQKKNSFNLVGAASAAEDIDIEKAISDMKKDTVLEQYKYFVNPVNLGMDADGTVRLKK